MAELRLALQQIEVLRKACDEKDKKIETLKQRLQESQGEYNNTEPVLLQKIRPFFVHDVDPWNVLHLIHAYDSKVLVELDIQEVQRITEQRGPIRGAGELLSRLVRYRGWLTCIVGVLRDCKVQQDHVAAKIEDIVENLEKDDKEKYSPELRIFWEEECRASKEKLGKEKEKQDAQVKKLAEEIGLKNAKINKAEQHIEKLEKAKEKQDAQLKKLADEISMKNAKINNAEESIEKLEKEKKKLDAQVRKLAEEISLKNTKINKAEQSIGAAAASHRLSTIDLLLLGRTGDGKSATGNTILGYNAFKTKSSIFSATTKVISEAGEYNGRVIRVVKVPGMADTRMDTEAGKKMAMDAKKNAIALSGGGFHAVLLVLRYGRRFTQEDKGAVEILKSIYGPRFMTDYCILILTCGDNFEEDSEEIDFTFESWCDEQSGVMKELMMECRKRIVLFDNKSKSKRSDQVDRLLKCVDVLLVSWNRETPWQKLA